MNSVLMLAFDTRQAELHVEHPFAERPDARVWLGVAARGRFQAGEGIAPEEVAVRARLDRQTKPLIEPPRLVAERDHWSAQLVLPPAVVDMLESAIAADSDLTIQLMLKCDGDPRRAPTRNNQNTVAIQDMHLKVRRTATETRR